MVMREGYVRATLTPEDAGDEAKLADAYFGMGEETP
jgi:hypothetical protein